VTDVGSKVAGVSWLVAGGFAAWAAARVVGADRVRQTETVLVPLMSFTPQVAAAAPLAALGLRLAGRRGPATTAVPPVGFRSVARRRSVVVLPAPFAPRSP